MARFRTRKYCRRPHYRVQKFMKIVWDEPKRLTNLAKHGLDFADLDTDFFRRRVRQIAFGCQL
jgi:hypothetical protein